MEISQKTIDTLKSAGWLPNRKVDIKEIEELLKSKGVEVYEPVKKFLEEFVNLNIQSVSDKMGGKIVTHHTKVSDLYDIYYIGSGESEAERNAGEALIPVGEISDGNFNLYISETGKMYCGMGKLGDTVWEGWARLIMEKGYMLWGSY